jgi:hypothetical protein
MAKDKKSFLVYCDLIHTVKKMRKEDVGELFIHLLEYTNDLEPETQNPIVDIVFEPIKQQLKRDLSSYKETISERSLSGRIGNLKRWNIDLFIQYEQKLITIEEAENIAYSRKLSLSDKSYRYPSQNIANVAVTDTVNVIDTDTVKGIVIDIKKLKENINTASPFKFFDSLISLGGEKQLVSDWIAVRKLKKLTNTLTAFENFKIEVSKSGKTINEVLKECVVNSWGGFKAEWINKNNVTLPTKKRVIS